MPRTLDFKSRSRFRRALYAKPTIILLAAILYLIAEGAWGMYEKSKEARDKTALAKEHVEELRARDNELSGDIDNLSTDRGVEGEIRDRFMVAKEGENVMIVADPDEEKVHTVTVPDSPPGVMQKMLGSVGL